MRYGREWGTRGPLTCNGSSRYKGCVAATDFRFDTGRLSLDLLATVGQRSGRQVERLIDPGRLGQWLAAQRLPVPAQLGERELARARQLREALQRLVAAAVRGEPAARLDLALVNEVAAAPAPPPVLRNNPRPPPPLLTRRAAPVTVDDALAAVARDAVDLLAGPQLRDLACCASDTCELYYLDPGHRRRYCDPRRCGTRARVAAHRARRAGTGPVPGPPRR